MSSSSMATKSGDNMTDAERGMLEGLIEALANKHSQLDLNFQKVSLKLPGMPLGVELNGVVSLSVHMREMTDEERQALAAKNLATVSTTA
jgi:hypothetical protein